MRGTTSDRERVTSRVLGAKLKRALAVSGFSGVFCTLAATVASFYVSSEAALCIAFLFFTASGSLFIVFGIMKKRISKIFLAAFVGTVLCMSSWIVGYIGYGSQRNTLCDGRQKEACLVLTDDGYKTPSGYYVYPSKLSEGPFSGEITVISRKPLECSAFSEISGVFKFSAPDGNFITTNYAASTVASVFVNGEDLSVSEARGFTFSKSVYAARKYIEEKIEAVADGEKGFLKALLLGRKKEMSLRRREALSDAGLSHIVAVSGLHISVFIAFISKLFSFVRNRFVRNITFILAVFLLAAVCGFTASVVRASLMSSLAFSGNLLRRKTDNLNNLGFAALVIATADPFSVVSASFLLSFGATLGIILLSEKLSVLASTEFFRLTRHYPNRVFRFFSGLFCTSLSAFFFTFPLLYIFFGEQSFVSILSNLVCLPLVSVLYPCAVGAVLLEMTGFLHPLASLLGFLCEKLTRLLMFLVYRLVRLRGTVGDMSPTEYLLSVLSASAIYIFFRKKRLPLLRPSRSPRLAAPVITFLILITVFSLF